MLYLLIIVEGLIDERQFSGKSQADSLGFASAVRDRGAILAAAVNSDMSPNVQFTDWPRSCRMFSALG
jgi:hypothetical protein